MTAETIDMTVPMTQVSHPHRPWWQEIGATVPRTVVEGARLAACPRTAGVPRLAVNPLTWTSMFIDELVMSTLGVAASKHELVDPVMRADSHEAVSRLAHAGVLDAPERLFAAPGGQPAELRTTSRRRSGLDFEHLSFDTDHRLPVTLPREAAWRAVRGNATAHAYLLRHGDRPRPWLLMLHGHRMGEPRDLRALWSKRLYEELGVDVAHLVLPMHGPRARDGAGSFPGIDPIVNLLGTVQAVYDARTLLAHLRVEGNGTIGVFGISLGGHLAALLAGLEPDLACVVAGVPTSDFATMFADTARQHWGDDAVAASGVEDDAFRALSRAVSPLSFPAKIPHERRFIYAAVADRLVTPRQAAALWRHWDRPEIHWLQGGHVINNRGSSRRFLTSALRRCGVTDDE